MSIASRTLLSVLAATALCTVAPHAQGVDSSSTVRIAPGSVVTTGSIKADATIVAIDATHRIITLKGRQGRVFDTIAGSEVRNFDQLRVGDKVSAEYTAAASLSLKKGGKDLRQSSEKETLDRAPAGAKPGGVATRTITVLAEVAAVDRKQQMVTLRGPAGHLVDLPIEDPAQLKNIRKGDQVEATYVEALAISVEPASAAK